MDLRSKLKGERSRPCAWLYSVVFAGKISAAAVLWLFLSFLIQPFHQALANEAAQEETAPVAEDVALEVDDSIGASSEGGDVAVEGDIVTSGEGENSLPENSNPSESASETGNETSLNEESDGDSKTSEVLTAGDLRDDTDEVEDDYSSTTVAQAAFGSVSTTENEINIEETASGDQNGTSSKENGAAIDSGEFTATTTGGVGEESTASTTVNQNIESGTGSTSSATSTVENSGGNQSGGGSSDVSEDADKEESGLETDIKDGVNDGGKTTGSGASDTVSSSNDKNNTPDNGEKTLKEAGVADDPAPVMAENIINDSNYYQFSKQSCVAVGDGTYHCSVAGESEVDERSLVYAAKDADGDKEIYIKSKGGKIKQLTDNDYDDTSPYFDTKTMRVVWQRMIGGRYQIMFMDLNEGKEVQLTFSSTNNMEPKISSDGIVWQAWDGHDWEIMYFNEEYTEQVTDNKVQDVAPVIEDGYILWSVIGGDKQEAKVYSIKDKKMMEIAEHDGGEILNPRFVLVYDTRYENGDVVTKGFDPLTGISSPITSKPAPMPVDIPNVDPTGEIRALLPTQTSHKDKNPVHASSTDKAAGSGPDPLLQNSSSTDTLNIKAIQAEKELDNTSATASASSGKPTVELNDYDLVITKKASSTKAAINEQIHTLQLGKTEAVISTSTKQTATSTGNKIEVTN